MALVHHPAPPPTVCIYAPRNDTPRNDTPVSNGVDRDMAGYKYIALSHKNRSL